MQRGSVLVEGDDAAIWQFAVRVSGGREIGKVDGVRARTGLERTCGRAVAGHSPRARGADAVQLIRRLARAAVFQLGEQGGRIDFPLALRRLRLSDPGGSGARRGRQSRERRRGGRVNLEVKLLRPWINRWLRRTVPVVVRNNQAESGPFSETPFEQAVGGIEDGDEPGEPGVGAVGIGLIIAESQPLCARMDDESFHALARHRLFQESRDGGEMVDEQVVDDGRVVH